MFLHRTNKGRVIYDRPINRFRSHDVLRIANKIMDGLQIGEMSSMISGVVILALTTVKDRDGSREALSLLGQILQQETAWISQVMSEEDLATLQWISDILTGGAATIEDFIKAYQRWRR